MKDCADAVSLPTKVPSTRVFVLRSGLVVALSSYPTVATSGLSESLHRPQRTCSSEEKTGRSSVPGGSDSVGSKKRQVAWGALIWEAPRLFAARDIWRPVLSWSVVLPPRRRTQHRKAASAAIEKKT
ncbi:hypothetical protein NDU88_010462 [Pleurodeles waltl]|uniref:Uncharacterized protein n=1 Tax=Pleurodeles waltl TaxID=8319 RepID=A0AAV7S1D1_PLEWA|nr:hypothetical protein NDU88_010462 [Pleurodeles waltl]